MHRLSNVDLANKRAVCSECGPVELVMYGGTRTCKNRHYATMKKYAQRRRAEWRQVHPAQPRGRKRTKPIVQREPKPRAYGTHAHTLSNIDDEKKTAICSICGPVRIYVSIHTDGKYITRRCSKANSQNVATAAKNRRDANRVFIDQYKVQIGCQRCGYNASPLGLDLHHRNPAEKDMTIADASKYSRERLMQELEKCDVLCAICHRLVHDELGYASQ